MAHYDELGDYQAAGIEAIKHTAVVKLNGGLGTTMGLDKAKSLLAVKDGHSFLELAALQIRHVRA